MSFKAKVTKAKEIKENGKYRNQFGALLVLESNDSEIFQGWEIDVGIDATRAALIVNQVVEVSEWEQREGKYGPWYSIKKLRPIGGNAPEVRSAVPGETIRPRPAPETPLGATRGGSSQIPLDDLDGHCRAYGRGWADYCVSVAPGCSPDAMLAFIGARIAWFQIEAARSRGVDLDLDQPAGLTPPPDEDESSIPF